MSIYISFSFGSNSFFFHFFYFAQTICSHMQYIKNEYIKKKQKKKKHEICVPLGESWITINKH